MVVRLTEPYGSVVRPNLTEPPSSAEPDPDPERFGRSLLVDDIDYEQPIDFIDVYLRQINEDPKNFEMEHLITTCLDFFQAGMSTNNFSPNTMEY